MENKHNFKQNTLCALNVESVNIFLNEKHYLHSLPCRRPPSRQMAIYQICRRINQALLPLSYHVPVSSLLLRLNDFDICKRINIILVIKKLSAVKKKVLFVGQSGRNILFDPCLKTVFQQIVI